MYICSSAHFILFYFKQTLILSLYYFTVTTYKQDTSALSEAGLINSTFAKYLNLII